MHEKKILKILQLNIYHPGNQLTAIFDQPLKTRALGSRNICRIISNYWGLNIDYKLLASQNQAYVTILRPNSLTLPNHDFTKTGHKEF